jgi:hypothetical protein
VIDVAQVLKHANERPVILEGQPVREQLVDALDCAQELGFGNEHEAEPGE